MPGVCSIMPLSRIGVSIPRIRASVNETSTWDSFRSGPRITTFWNILLVQRCHSLFASQTAQVETVFCLSKLIVLLQKADRHVLLRDGHVFLMLLPEFAIVVFPLLFFTISSTSASYCFTFLASFIQESFYWNSKAL